MDLSTNKELPKPLETGFWEENGEDRVLRPGFKTSFGKNCGWKQAWHDRFRQDFSTRFPIKQQKDLIEQMDDDGIENVRRLVFESFKSSYCRQARKQSSEAVQDDELQAGKVTTPKERQKSRRALVSRTFLWDCSYCFSPIGWKGKNGRRKCLSRKGISGTCSSHLLKPLSIGVSR